MPLPPSPPLFITSTAAQPLFCFFPSWRGTGLGKRGAQPHGAGRQTDPRRSGGSAAAEPLPHRGHLLSPGPAAAASLPSLATRDPRTKGRDPGENHGGSGKERRRPRGWRGAAGGRYSGWSLLALPPVLRRSAAPGARRSAEEITVRSITCQTSNWIGYFPPLFVTDSIHIPNSESPVGIMRIEPFCKSG